MTLRAAMVAVLVCGVYAIVVFRPIRDVDMFWQVRTGEVMLETGRLVQTDPFSSTHPGESTPTIYWLSQLFYALALKWGSWEVLHRFDALLFALALGCVGWAARTPREHPIPTAAAVGLAFLIALPHHGLRPQTFGLIGFAALVWLSRSALGFRWKLSLLFALTVLWQNLHPSAMTAALYLGLVAVAGLIDWFRLRPSTFPADKLLLAAVAGLATVLTPDGFGILTLSTQNAATSQMLGIEEWLPIWHEATWPASRMVWFAVGGTLVLLLLARGQLQTEEVVLTLGLGLAGVLVYRMSLFWTLAMVPIWARWLEAIVLTFQTSSKPGRVHPALPLGLALAAMLFSIVIRPAIWDPSIPRAGAEAVRQRQLVGTIYNYREWGGPLLAAAHPQVRVTIDGRLYLYPREDWVDYVRVALGERPLEWVETQYQPEAFFLRPSYHGPLIQSLRTSGRWDEAYADEHCILFVKPEPRTVASSRPGLSRSTSQPEQP